MNIYDEISMSDDDFGNIMWVRCCKMLRTKKEEKIVSQYSKNHTEKKVSRKSQVWKGCIEQS